MTNKELLVYIQKIQNIMTSVSTGGETIQNRNKEYIEIYFKILQEFQKRNFENKNNFSSLWDFYGYWSRELPSYQNRREFIRSLYKQYEDDLVLGTMTNLDMKEKQKILQKQKFCLSFDDLHEDIILKCKDYFLIKKYDDAIFNALKLVETKTRKKAKLDDSDIGVKLMDKAFAPDKTIFNISDDNGEVDGWKNLFRGMIGALKNPSSHRFIEINNQMEAFQILCFTSYLLFFIDNLQEKTTEENILNIPF